MYRLISRSGSKGIQIANNEASRASKLVISRDLPGPCTICTEEPVRAPGRHKFEVAMARKGVRTAVGYMGMQEPSTSYMTPDYISSGYVSMGGAGFIYPAKATASGTYGEGDTVGCEVDFDRGVVVFSVNGKVVGQGKWMGSPVAYPAISVFSGDLECHVTYS